ncbi:hypothetical protein [Chitinophaga varians]|uniref:hypothetical protein n=1 Tax=Chitinophaga varians TaxID=2202339 RepID=UPI00165F2FB4|nr:hypothetical protein [Chitinophaga varians]MBC9913152.1 hypothetical protein [Chitinophaga varians]
MSEKLDTYSKILLATQTINYLASNMNTVITQVRSIPGMSQIQIDGAAATEEVLIAALSQLTTVMEALGDYVNNVDMVCTIDERVTNAAFDILIHGKDKVEE